MIALFLPLVDKIAKFNSESSFSYKLSEGTSGNLYQPYGETFKKFQNEKSKLIRSAQYMTLEMFDIKDFYPSIKNIGRFIDDLLRFELKENTISFTNIINNLTINGLPQGLEISGFLSEFVLYFFDLSMSNLKDVKYFRYVDDIVIFHNSIDSLEDLVMKYLLESLPDTMNVSFNREKHLFRQLNQKFSDLYEDSYNLDFLNEITSDFDSLSVQTREYVESAIKNLNRDFEAKSTKLGDVLNNRLNDPMLVSKTQYRYRIIYAANYDAFQDVVSELTKTKDFYGGNFRNYIDYIYIYFKKNNLPDIRFKRILNDIKISKKKYRLLPDRNYYDKIIEYYNDIYEKYSLETMVYPGKFTYNEETLLKTIRNIHSVCVSEKKVFGIYTSIQINNISKDGKVHITWRDRTSKLSRPKIINEKLKNGLSKLFNYHTGISATYKLKEYRIMKRFSESNDLISNLSFILNVLGDNNEEHKLSNTNIDSSYFEIYDKYIEPSCLKAEEKDYITVLHHYIKDLWQNGAKDLPFFTLHNHEHSLELLKKLYQLDDSLMYKITGSVLNCDEFFALLAAIYIHDLGMLYFNYDYYYKSVDNGKYIRKELETYISSLEYYDETKPANTNKEVTRTIYNDHKSKRSDFTRDKHSKTSKEFHELVKKGCVTDEFLIDIFAIGYNHGVDEKKFIKVSKSLDREIDMVKTSKFLRLLDSLDQSITRVSFNMYEFLKQVEKSDSRTLGHWAKHILTKGVNFKRLSTKLVELEMEFFNLEPLSGDKRFSDKGYNFTINKDSINLTKKSNSKDSIYRFFNHFFYYTFKSIGELNEILEAYSLGFQVKISLIKGEDEGFDEYLDDVVSYITSI